MTLFAISKKLVILIIMAGMISWPLRSAVSPTAAASSEKEQVLIAEFSDPSGDDHGPGFYEYPNHSVFSPQEELLDLLSFYLERIADGEYYRFIFEFARITDPWDSKYGFSHPLIHLYIDSEEGGSDELFRSGANVSLQEEHPWNKHLRISGWWVRLITPADDPWDMTRDLNIDAESSPWDVEEAQVETTNNRIKVDIPGDKIGELAGSWIYLLVGGFDPFGEDYFRGLQNRPTNWSFQSTEEVDLDIAPRVIDYLATEEGKQEKMLADFSTSYPEIKPVKIPALEEPFSPNRYLLSFFYLLLGGVIMAGLFWLVSQKNQKNKEQ